MSTFLVRKTLGEGCGQYTVMSSSLVAHCDETWAERILGVALSSLINATVKSLEDAWNDVLSILGIHMEMPESSSSVLSLLSQNV